MDFQQNMPSGDQNEQNSGQNQQTPESSVPNQEMPPYGNNNETPYQNQQTHGNNTGAAYQNQQSYGNNAGAACQNQQSYGNNTEAAYQNQQTYENNNMTPSRSNSLHQNHTPYNNNGYNNTNNGYNNGYPYYNRNAYQLPQAEPGSNLAGAAMVLGILSIVTCFTFTVYPAFVLGSIAIVLALLSKGTRSRLFPRAKTGIICATIGLAANTVLVTSCMFLIFTDPDVRAEVNRTFEKTYGVSFDDVMEDIMENNGYSY